MKKKIVIACILFLAATQFVYGWGIWGHNHINKGAILALPPEMGMFFYNHADFIIQESTVPDLRKYTLNDKSEHPRHYINLEQYAYGRLELPRTRAEAEEKYSKDTISKYGILPWYIQEMMVKLTEAMKNKRKTEILFLAADLGHYIGDAHMPLHTTVEHDGQSTGQKGIHAFWESQLPEIFGKGYKLNTDQAHYIKDIEKATWAMVDSSYSLHEKLLTIEFKLRKNKPLEKQYVLAADGTPQKNKFGVPIHNYEYAHVYHELLDGMVEKQLRAAIQFTANCWYTAWVNAGKPDLSELDSESQTEQSKPLYKADMKAWQKGKIRGCSADKEFPKVTD